MSREKIALVFTVIGFIVVLVNFVPPLFETYVLGLPAMFWGIFFTGLILLPVITLLWIYIDEKLKERELRELTSKR